KELRSLRVRATISAPIMRLLAAASLETLDLQGSTMMPGVLTELAKSTTLEHLDLTDIKGDLSGLRATLARIPNLKTVWLGDHFEVLPALAELRQSIPAVQVNGHPAYRENEPSREEIVKEALARYSAELNDPTMEEGARDRSVGQRMKRRISYDWVDTPLPAALQSIENQCGVAIVIDPAVSDFPSITLRVTEMTCDLALDWILRLADMQYLIRGQAIIVTSQQKLLRRALTKELAVEGAQGRAWTQEELGLLARAIETLPLVRESGVDGEVFRRTGVATGSVPGGIKIEGTAYAMAHIERFVEDFVNVKPPVYVAPAWIGRIDAALDKKLDLQREKLGSVIEALSRETGLKIVLSPKITDTHRVVSASGTAREVLEQIAQQAQLTVQYLPHALFVSRDLMPQTVPYVFSVESALKAGISPEDLLAAIRTMAEESKAEFVPVLIRDRCIGSFDLWTFKRVVQMLEQSVAARKLTIPAAPWFFATYKNKGAPAAPPPQERGIDRGSGAAVPDSPQDE
ncbi:MAG TPA: STN domain-containing protein, partial [Planctomycetota bacterium]|nr:STN domain-containing protein [Planctomycetota bacterium]